MINGEVKGLESKQQSAAGYADQVKDALTRIQEIGEKSYFEELDAKIDKLTRFDDKFPCDPASYQKIIQQYVGLIKLKKAVMRAFYQIDYTGEKTDDFSEETAIKLSLAFLIYFRKNTGGGDKSNNHSSLESDGFEILNDPKTGKPIFIFMGTGKINRGYRVRGREEPALRDGTEAGDIASAEYPGSVFRGRWVDQSNVTMISTNKYKKLCIPSENMFDSLHNLQRMGMDVYRICESHPAHFKYESDAEVRIEEWFCSSLMQDLRAISPELWQSVMPVKCVLKHVTNPALMEEIFSSRSSLQQLEKARKEQASKPVDATQATLKTEQKSWASQTATVLSPAVSIPLPVFNFSSQAVDQEDVFLSPAQMQAGALAYARLVEEKEKNEADEVARRFRSTLLNIQGLDKAAVFAVLYNNSSFAKTGLMTEEQAKKRIASEGLIQDFLKVTLEKDELDLSCYKRDNGENAFEAVKEMLKLMRDFATVSKPVSGYRV